MFRQGQPRQSRGGDKALPGDAFTPTRPRPGRNLIGRQRELERILRALLEEQAHVVLYSERGRGKTSLSNLVVESLRRAGSVVARYTCEAGTNFDMLLRGLARDLPAGLLASAVSPAADAEGCEAALPEGVLRPRDAAAFPSRLTCRSLVCVVDEFDRIEDPGARTLLADTIKLLSDQGVALSFMIVGVSENLEQILGQHPSIQRALVAVSLPLLTDSDVADLIRRGGADLGLGFAPLVMTQVVEQARGMPYAAQLMGLRLAQSAVGAGRTLVDDADFEAASRRLIDETPGPVVASYAALTAGGRDLEMVDILHRIAIAPQDCWGRLRVEELGDGGLVIGGEPVAPALAERLHRAEVLRFVEAENGRDGGLTRAGAATFSQRGLMHYILLLASVTDAGAGASSGNPAPRVDALAGRAPAQARVPYIVSGGGKNS